MKHSFVRENIIITASSLFYQNGYNSTGINEIILESGIAKATLYNHFKSKEDLCLSYLKYMNENFLEKINKYCYSKPKGKKQILALFDFLLQFFKKEEFNGCWCIKTISELPKNNIRIRKEIQRQKNQFIEFISEIVESNSTSLKSSKNNSIVKQIYLLYESAVGESHLHESKWPITEAKKICSQII